MPNTPLLQFMHDTVGRANNIKSLAELWEAGKIQKSEEDFTTASILQAANELDKNIRDYLHFGESFKRMTDISSCIVSSAEAIRNHQFQLGTVQRSIIAGIIKEAEHLNTELDNYYIQNKPKN